MDDRLTIEHWREGECIECFELAGEIITEGTNIVIPVGRYIEIVGEDELRIKKAE